MLRKILNRNCKQIEPLLWECADGRLEPEQKAQVDAHLVCCAICRANLQAIAQIGQGLDALKQAPIPATQTNWADAQARLMEMPSPLQSPPFSQRAGRYRLLMGAGMVAMALLWFSRVPRNSQQALPLTQKGDMRPAKRGMVSPTPETSLTYGIATMKEPMAFEKQSRPENGDAPYRPHPIAPEARITKASFTEAGSMRNRFGLGRRKRAVRVHRFARRESFLAARRRIELQNAIAKNELGETRALITEAALYRQTPNYVLTDAEVESTPHTPRAYVMDCISTNAKCRTAAGTEQTGEERAW